METKLRNYLDFSKILFKYKNEHFKILYIILTIVLATSILFSIYALNNNEINPYITANTFSMSSLLFILLPFISILSFFDLYSGLKENKVMKKLLSEPITWRDIYFSGIYFIIFYSLLITLFIVIPESIISYMIASQRSMDLFLRSISVAIPIFLYLLYWGSIAIFVSSISKKDSISVTVTIFIYFLLAIILPSIISQLVTNISSFFGIGEYESVHISTFFNNILPSSSFSNGINIIFGTDIVKFSYISGYFGYLNTNINFYNSFFYSIYSLLPLFIYLFLALLILLFSIRRIGYDY